MKNFTILKYLVAYCRVSAVRISMKKNIILDLNITYLKLLSEDTGVCGDLRPNQLIILTIQFISQKWDRFKYSVRIGFISMILNWFFNHLFEFKYWSLLNLIEKKLTVIFQSEILEKKSKNCIFFCLFTEQLGLCYLKMFVLMNINTASKKMELKLFYLQVQ